MLPTSSVSERRSLLRYLPGLCRRKRVRGREGRQAGSRACWQGAFNSWRECKLPMPAVVTPLSAQSALWA